MSITINNVCNDKQLVISKMQSFINMSKDVVLTNAEANRLFHVSKFYNTNESHTLSESKFSLSLLSEDGRDRFMFDFSSSSIVLRYKLQIRANRMFPLLRLDLGGSFHDNPNQEVECAEDDPFRIIHHQCIGKHFEIGEPHIHYYREGFEDSWAYPVPSSFKDLSDIYQTYVDFMHLCNVVKRPNIRRSLDEFL